VEKEHTTQEISRLRRCINDLASILALPAIWTGHDSSRVIVTLLDVVVRMLDLDFAYARTDDPANESPREWIRSAGNHCAGAHEIGRALEPYLPDETPGEGLRIANPIADGTGSIAIFHLGVQDRVGVFVAASRRSEFPTESERLLLQVATNQAAIALQEARLIAQREQELVTQELRRSEFYLAERQRLSHSGSWSFTPSGICDYWSQELYRILGFDPANGIPTIPDYLNIVHPEDREFVQGTINQMVAEGIGCDVKKRIIRPDGELRVIRCVGTPVHENGVVTRFIGTLMDITDQERMTQELRRKEAYLAEAQRLSQTGSFGWSVSSGEIFWSEETFRIFEYDRATKPTLELALQRVHPEDKSLVQQMIDRAGLGGKDFDFEHRLLMPDGSIKYLHVVAHGIKDELDQVEFVGAVTDITATKSAEHRIQEDERELRQILDLTPQHLGVLGPDGKPLYANHAALEYFGITIDQWRAEATLPQATHSWLGSRLDLIHPDDREHFLGERKNRFLEGEPHEFEARLLRHDGECRWFLFRLSPLKDERGHITRWYGTATDIEDRKRAEEGIRKENIALREEIDKASMFEEIVGSSATLRKVLSEVGKVAPTDSTVLITGETGTGKELIARAIHKRSQRSSRAFVSVNCAAIPQSLIASELFGHEKGAFTGALQRRLGRFELAEGGTIFLDEIGDLPADTQNTLLRVLQEREFERVGGTEPIRANVRVIAATNRDLKASMNAGAFRSDLFYRLNVFPIEMPALRSRREDIAMLVEYFIDRYASKAGKKIRRINKGSLKVLQSYPWPGNIRELQNVIERSVIVCETETLVIDENWLSRESVKLQPPSRPLFEELLARERERIEAALAETRGRVSGPSGAAAKLGIPRSTLDSKIRSLKINTHRFKSA
jgi:PAS domain S-box-containing protein